MIDSRSYKGEETGQGKWKKAGLKEERRGTRIGKRRWRQEASKGDGGQ